MCDGHLLLRYYSEITSGVDPIHIPIPGVKVFLSERLCQDPLELFLDARGNVVALMRILLFKRSTYKNTQALRVINSFHFVWRL